MTDFAWTDAAQDRLRKLWTDGLSTSQIGTVLGCGKNAVVGKAHRLHLPRRPSPVRRAPVSDEQLLHWHSLGRSVPQIAVLGNVARDTVLARLRNCGIDIKKPAPAPRVTLPPMRATEPVAVKLPPVRPEPPVRPVVRARHTCQWLTNDAKPWRFCGAPATGVYCEEHKAMARA